MKTYITLPLHTLVFVFLFCLTNLKANDCHFHAITRDTTLTITRFTDYKNQSIDSISKGKAPVSTICKWWTPASYDEYVNTCADGISPAITNKQLFMQSVKKKLSQKRLLLTSVLEINCDEEILYLVKYQIQENSGTKTSGMLTVKKSKKGYVICECPVKLVELDVLFRKISQTGFNFLINHDESALSGLAAQDADTTRNLKQSSYEDEKFSFTNFLSELKSLRKINSTTYFAVHKALFIQENDQNNFCRISSGSSNKSTKAAIDKAISIVRNNRGLSLQQGIQEAKSVDLPEKTEDFESMIKATTDQM